MTTITETREGLQAQAVAAAEIAQAVAGRELAAIEKLDPAYYTEQTKKDLRAKLARELRPRLDHVVEVADAHLSLASIEARETLERRPWLDAAKIQDRQTRYNPVWSGMTAQELWNVVERLHGSDPEGSAVAADHLEARLAALPPRDAEGNFLAARLLEIRNRPGTPQGEANHRAREVQKARQYRDTIANYAGAILADVEAGKPSHQSELLALTLRLYPWDRPLPIASSGAGAPRADRAEVHS
jgi:hypothetical protein